MTTDVVTYETKDNVSNCGKGELSFDSVIIVSLVYVEIPDEGLDGDAVVGR